MSSGGDGSLTRPAPVRCRRAAEAGARHRARGASIMATAVLAAGLAGPILVGAGAAADPDRAAVRGRGADVRPVPSRARRIADTIWLMHAFRPHAAHRRRVPRQR